MVSLLCMDKYKWYLIQTLVSLHIHYPPHACGHITIPKRPGLIKWEIEPATNENGLQF